jgi:hypothetical protein
MIVHQQNKIRAFVCSAIFDQSDVISSWFLYRVPAAYMVEKNRMARHFSRLRNFTMLYIYNLAVLLNNM